MNCYLFEERRSSGMVSENANSLVELEAVVVVALVVVIAERKDIDDPDRLMGKGQLLVAVVAVEVCRRPKTKPMVIAAMAVRAKSVAMTIQNQR